MLITFSQKYVPYICFSEINIICQYVDWFIYCGSTDHDNENQWNSIVIKKNIQIQMFEFTLQC